MEPGVGLNELGLDIQTQFRRHKNCSRDPLRLRAVSTLWWRNLPIRPSSHVLPNLDSLGPPSLWTNVVVRAVLYYSNPRHPYLSFLVYTLHKNSPSVVPDPLLKLPLTLPLYPELFITVPNLFDERYRTSLSIVLGDPWNQFNVCGRGERHE